MFYAVYIAVCLSGMAPQDCNKTNAVHWIVAPERQDSIATCFMFGEQYIAQTSLIVPGETYPKIYCEPMQAEE